MKSGIFMGRALGDSGEDFVFKIRLFHGGAGSHRDRDRDRDRDGDKNKRAG